MTRLRTTFPILLTALLTATATAQDPMPPTDGEGFVEIADGARIYYQTWGEGQPILLIHGYPLNGGLFRDNVAALAQQYQVVTVDLRGYGQSETPDDQASIALYASDVLAVMDELDLPPAIVGGMSMGGPIVFELYRQAPDRFAGMILIDTIAAAAAPPEAGLWRGVAEQVEGKGPDSLIGFLMPDMLTGDTRTNRPELVDHLSSLMQAASVDAWLGGANALATRPDSTATLPEIQVPTLILVGLEDSLYAFAIAQGMQEQIPDARLEILPGASHAANFEAAEAANAAILDWARSIE